MRTSAVRLSLVALVGGLVLASNAQGQGSPPLPDPASLPAAMEEDPTLPGFTVYHPRQLPARGRLPILVWGNGACMNVGNMYPEFHAEIASHGYLVIATGPTVPGFKRPSVPRPTASSPPAAAPTSRPPMRPDMTKSEQLIQAIDWAAAENARAGSKYYGKLDPTKVAAMGHSCGGVQAMWAGLRDARIRTVIFGNSSLLDPPIPGVVVLPSELARLKKPVAYLIGGPSDIAYPTAESNFALIKTVPVFKGNVNVGHGGTYYDPKGGEFGRAALGWLDWQLKGDAKAARLFKGPDCGLCKDPHWTVERKMLD